jgi:signal transduction histidine kinase
MSDTDEEWKEASRFLAPVPDDVDSQSYLVRLQEEFEFAPHGELWTDGHGVILGANHAASALLQCPKEFLPGKPLGLFFVPDDRSRFYACLSRLWRGSSADSFDARVNRRDLVQRDLAVVVTKRRDVMSERRDTACFHWRFMDVTDRKRAEAARDELLRRLVTLQEDERRRVARELHDSIGQLLTALALAVDATRKSAPLPSAAEGKLAEVQSLSEELGRTVRDLIFQLRPTALDDGGLCVALGQHVAEWSARTGIVVDYEATAVQVERLPSEMETAVYRIVQEALTNVARHARAHWVSVVVSAHAGQVTVAVEDDGIGFDPEAPIPPGKLGFIGMRERAALVGGSLDVESSPGGGTTVLARFPLGNKEEVTQDK